MAAAGEGQRVHHPVEGERRPGETRQFGIDEADVEGGVVDHQRILADEGEELVDHRGEERLVGEELGGQAVDVERLDRHVAFGIEIDVEGLPGRDAVEYLDAADLHQPVAGERVEARGLGVEHDLTHRDVPSAALPAAFPPRRGHGRGHAPVSIRKSARRRFSRSGICRARIAANFSSVMPGRARTRARCTDSGAVTTHRRVDAALRPALEQQGDVEHGDVVAGLGCAFEEGAFAGTHQGMDDGLEALHRRVVAEHLGAEQGAVDRGRRW